MIANYYIKISKKQILHKFKCVKLYEIVPCSSREITPLADMVAEMY